MKDAGSVWHSVMNSQRLGQLLQKTKTNMLKSLSLPNFLPFSSQAKPASRRTFVKVARFKPVSAFRFYAGIILTALSFAALLWYVAGVNGNASMGYEIKNLQSKISRLNDQNEQLNLKVSEASSMVAIQSDFLNSNFVAAGPATYLQLHPVAMNVK
jgi:cell division protein FtsL